MPIDKEIAERALRDRFEWFVGKYAPADRMRAAEWHADVLMLVQAVHRDASRETHALLTHALTVMPNPRIIIQKPEQQPGEVKG